MSLALSQAQGKEISFFLFACHRIRFTLFFQKRHASGTPAKWIEGLSGKWDSVPNRGTVPVDVRDVARAHIRAFEDAESEGRYAAVAPGRTKFQDIADACHRVDPSCKVPKKVGKERKNKSDGRKKI